MSRILLYHSSYHCNLFFITMQSFARISACILLVVGNNDSQKAVHLSKICQLEGHPFKNLYLTIAPSTLLDTPISNWSNTQWSKAIRMMAPADRNAIALSGGLTVPDNYGIGNKNQAFNPEIICHGKCGLQRQ